MHDLFDPASRDELLSRLDRLEPTSPRQWGKMDAAQMCAHCSVALEVGTGDHPLPRRLLGKLIGWAVRSQMLGPRAVPRNAPTDPDFVVADARELKTEKERLQAVITRFCELGPDHAARQTHSFLGRLSGPEWGRLMARHLDHHLRQFGV